MSTIAVLQRELLAEKSARMVERAALSFYANLDNWHYPEHKEENEKDHINRIDDSDLEKLYDSTHQGGRRAIEALSQPAPDVGAVIRQLVSALEYVAATPNGQIGLGPKQKAKRALADTEADRKRMGL